MSGDKCHKFCNLKKLSPEETASANLRGAHGGLFPEPGWSSTNVLGQVCAGP